ncbi:hypothetical protein K2X92_05295 [Candidatus Gracilibacteria bacterium]|nr:hypothetical protein [Candidatus Gracilibacteria bacterium]
MLCFFVLALIAEDYIINDIIIFIILIIVLGIGSYIIYIIVFYIGKNIFIKPTITIINHISETIIKLGITIDSDILTIQSIDAIIEKTSEIKELQKTLQRSQIFLSIFTKNIVPFFSSLMKDTDKWVLSILINLRSDLSIRLTEQQKSLKSAKSEVEENIQGTTELDQVSELQKTRLDKQIEQFEELQRVLVKT